MHLLGQTIWETKMPHLRFQKSLKLSFVALSLIFSQAIFAQDNSKYLETTERAKAANELYTSLHGNEKFFLEDTDPQMSALMKKYLYADIASQSALSREHQELVTLVTLTTLQANDNLLEHAFVEALNAGVSPLKLREAVYQCVPYIGIAREIMALESLNEIFKEKNIKLPLEDVSTTNDENRFTKGLEFQVGTYGERIVKMRKSTPDNQKHLQDDLSAFCFGDIYTRQGLSLKEREILTVAAIGTLGEEPQFKSHIRGLIAAGGSHDEVIGVITSMNPYLGFPRTLNLMKYANEVFKGLNK